MSDLLIKINADAKNAEQAFDEVKAQTEDLENQLNKVATISGVAFAALTAEIYLSVKAFEEGAVASRELSTALQNQGIYTAKLSEQYKEYADTVKAATGIDDDAITKAQAVAQTYLGQTKITKELTFAIADLGASMGGDLNAAAEKIGRTIGTTTNAFAKQGLQISDTATEAERAAKVMEFVQAKAGGLAADLNKAGGYANSVAIAFGDLQKAIGARFAPAVELGRQKIAAFFDAISNNPVLVDIIASLITAGAVIAGLATAVAIAIPAFTALTAAMAAFGVASNVALAGIPAAIGLVVAALTYMALNWDKTVAYVRSLTAGLSTFITESFSGISKVITGAFTLDTGKITEGINQLKGAYTKAKDDSIKTFQDVTAGQAVELEKQDQQRKAFADKEAAKKREHQANLVAIEKATLELLRLQNEYASQAQIDLKTKEIEVLKALDQEKSAAEIQLLKERRDQILALEDEQKAEDLERLVAFEQLKAETKAELDQQNIQVTTELRDAQLQQLQAQAQSEADIERQLQADILTRRTNARNQELLDRKKYGVAIALINQAITSEEVKGVADASKDLVALQQSKNQTLKEIGKAAAVADITISTAQAAMRIYTGFATIPIVGPALGVAGAAAAVAFGAERISQVTSAADGGEITGGVPGKDSVPAMLMPGELVVPARNFDEVVGAVQTDRGGSNEQTDLLKQISEKLNNTGNYIFNGDLSTDESFVDNFVKKISDAVEFRNAKIVGINA